MEADLAFHRAIFQAAHNEFLLFLVNSMAPALRRSRELTISLLVHPALKQLTKQAERILQEDLERHRAVWQAIRDRNCEAAQRATIVLLDALVQMLHYMLQQADQLDETGCN